MARIKVKYLDKNIVVNFSGTYSKIEITRKAIVLVESPTLGFKAVYNVTMKTNKFVNSYELVKTLEEMTSAQIMLDTSELKKILEELEYISLNDLANKIIINRDAIENLKTLIIAEYGDYAILIDAELNNVEKYGKASGNIELHI